MWSNHQVTESANLISTLLAAETSRIVSGGVSTPISALRAEAGLWAGHLQSRHDKGAKIGVVSRNDVSFVSGYLACLAAGMVAVPMNPFSPESERIRDMQAVSMAEILVGPSAAHSVPSLQVAAPNAIVTVMESMNVTGMPIDPLDDAVAVEPDDIAVLLFTSGTAGLRFNRTRSELSSVIFFRSDSAASLSCC